YIPDEMNENNNTFINDFINAPSMAHIIFLAMAMFSLSLVTVLGNAIVIYALRTNRNLRTVIIIVFFF
ncbi:unnamed protein product, partial [Adineta steineri]